MFRQLINCKSTRFRNSGKSIDSKFVRPLRSGKVVNLLADKLIDSKFVRPLKSGKTFKMLYWEFNVSNFLRSLSSGGVVNLLTTKSINFKSHIYECYLI